MPRRALQLSPLAAGYLKVWPVVFLQKKMGTPNILLMEEFLHQLIGSLSPLFTGLYESQVVSRISSINSIEQSSLLGVSAGLWRDPPRARRPLRDTAPCVASATGPDDDDCDTFSFPSCFTRWVGILPKNIHGNWKIDHWKRKFKNYLLDMGSFEWV